MATTSPLLPPQDQTPLPYEMTRALVDWVPIACERLGDLGLTANSEIALAAASENWPLGEEGVRACLAVARQAAEAENDEVALGYVLRALHRYPDAGPTRPLRLPQNQRYLADATYLPDAKTLSEMLSLALQCAVGSESHLDPDKLKGAVSDWVALEKAANTRDKRLLLQAAHTTEPSVDGLQLLASLHIAQVLLRCGYFRGAIEKAGQCMLDASTARQRPLRRYAAYMRGEARAAISDYEGATDDLRIAAESKDRWLSGVSLLEEAEATEFAGQVPEATKLYTGLADPTGKGWWWARLRAEATVRRLKEAAPSSPERRNVVYLGEDRQTQGAWFRHFGGEAFVLCAQRCPSDLEGGPLASALSLGRRTGLSSDPARSWRGGTTSDDLSLLYDPLDDDHVHANWDDHGEAYTPGAGPDLLISCAIPRGLHRLSFCFVNDFAYYEPSRDYTMQVLDEAGRVLAATQVRHFVGGVYKLFGVAGPVHLTVRIRRNASLNVLLSGVFLDELPLAEGGDPVEALATIQGLARKERLSETTIPATVEGATQAWREADSIHQEPAMEQGCLGALASAVATRDGAEKAHTFLWDMATGALRDNRTWVAGWSCDTLVDLLTSAGSDEFNTSMERAALAFLQPRNLVVSQQFSLDRPICLPYARELFLRILTEFKTDDEAIRYCRDFAQRQAFGNRALVAIALGHVVDKIGGSALTPDELVLFSAASGRSEKLLVAVFLSRSDTGRE